MISLSLICCFLKDFFPYHIDTTCMQLPFGYFNGSHKYDVFLSLKVVFILANSADTDEMQHHAVFYLSLHCLPKNPIRGFLFTKD